METKFKKYRQNLSLVNNNKGTFIKSYDTLVAKVKGTELEVLGWWSQTTSKHINYAASELGLTIKK
jgi:hypothetical protein